MADLGELEAAARELVARHGRAAIVAAMTRATQAEKTGGSLPCWCCPPWSGGFRRWDDGRGGPRCRISPLNPEIPGGPVHPERSPEYRRAGVPGERQRGRASKADCWCGGVADAPTGDSHPNK